MNQSVAQAPDLGVARKAAVANGRPTDHAGRLVVEPIPDFSLDDTIFDSIEGEIARLVVRTRIGTRPRWDPTAAERIEASYRRACTARPLPQADPELIRFLVEECDFRVEHADGSFLDHLFFCFEYTVHHYPERSPVVSLLHSVLGTGTNSFAMEAEKIPLLEKQLTDFEWRHVAAFPSILRLLHDHRFRRALRANLGRLDRLQRVDFFRVIDNEAMSLDGEDFFIQLNYQLIHLIDFVPVANWTANCNEVAFIIFRDLHDLLRTSGKLEARVGFERPGRLPTLRGEPLSLPALLTKLIPVSLSERMASRSIREFSERIGHSMDFDLTFR